MVGPTAVLIVIISGPFTEEMEDGGAQASSHRGGNRQSGGPRVLPGLTLSPTGSWSGLGAGTARESPAHRSPSASLDHHISTLRSAGTRALGCPGHGRVAQPQDRGLLPPVSPQNAPAPQGRSQQSDPMHRFPVNAPPAQPLRAVCAHPGLASMARCLAEGRAAGCASSASPGTSDTREDVSVELGPAH